MFVHIGHGSMISKDKIIGVLPYDSAPNKYASTKRLLAAYEKDPNRTVIDATNTKKARSVVVCADGQLWISVMSPDGIQRRMAQAEIQRPNDVETGEEEEDE